MLKKQLLGRGIHDRNVIRAFSNIPRELFVPEDYKKFAYEDRPLPIGFGQTISQPYIAALMTEALHINKGDKVLEIGTGSGYQSAVLSYLGAKVYSIERVNELAGRAKDSLKALKLEAEVNIGDGTLGWDEYAPYDRITVTAASENVPLPLLDQLKNGGDIIAPIGTRWRQELTLIHKIGKSNVQKTSVCGCVFVPLIGKYGYKE